MATAASCALELWAALGEELNQAGQCPRQSKEVVSSLGFVLLLYGGLEFITKQKLTHQCKGITEFLGCLEHSHEAVTWRCSKDLEDPGSNMPGCRQAILTALLDIAVRRCVLWCREFSAEGMWCGSLRSTTGAIFHLS